MIDINTIDNIFLSILQNGYIKYTSIPFDKSITDFNLTAKAHLKQAIIKIVNRDWMNPPIINFDEYNMVGKEIDTNTFLGKKFNFDKESLQISKKKKLILESNVDDFDIDFFECDYNKPQASKKVGLSECIIEEKSMSGNFKGSYEELSSIFLNLKENLIDIEEPYIMSWNDKWSNYFYYGSEYNTSYIWTLLYKNSKQTIVLITDPCI